MGYDADQGSGSVEKSAHALGARLRHLEAVDAVTRAMGSTCDPGRSIALGLEALRQALAVDRTSLLCFEGPGLEGPEPGRVCVRFIDTAPDWPAYPAGTVLELAALGRELQRRLREAPASPHPVRVDLEPMLRSERMQALGTRGLAGVGLRPADGCSWLLSAHVCQDGRALTPADEAVLQDAGSRLTTALDLLCHSRQAAERETRLSAIAERAPVGVFMLAAGQLEYANGHLAQVFGQPDGEPLRALDVGELLGAEACRGTCDHCLTGHAGHAFVHRTTVEHPSRGRREVEVSCAPVEELGTPHMVGTLVDVTDRLALREQMATMAKMAALASLVGGVAHHFNNLLAGILGNIYVMEDAPDRDPWEREALSDMRKSGERAATLVKQLMTFARKGTSSLVEADLVELVETTVATLELALPASASIQLDLPATSLIALIDLGAVQGIVLNLVDNAKRALASRARQHIVLRLRCVPATAEEAEQAPRGWAELRVEDGGEGIRPEDLPHVFEPFFTTRDVGQGTGMGLATVYGSVGRMGGDVRLESEVGQGTRAIVRIPLVKPSVVYTPAHASVLPGAGEVLLVVDDDDTVRAVLRRVLSHLGYKADVFSSAAEAIAAFDADPGRYAALLSDMVMPEMGGCALAGELRTRRPELPVLLMTGYDPYRLEGVAQIPGEPPRVLSKPLRINQLSRAVAKLIRRQADPSPS